MPLNRSDFADLGYFLAIVRHRRFHAAALQLGISASALSHALKSLETRLGVRLVNRTNRSMTLTAAGEELRSAIAEPFDIIEQAVHALDRFREAPTGRIRLNVLEDAATVLLGPVLPVFLARYPGIEIDLWVDNRRIDVTEEGFDAGIRYGDTVPADMIAQRLSGPIRWIVAGAPSYLEQFGTPLHPDDLSRHRCLRFRLGDGRMYRWEFEQAGETIAVAVPGSLTVNETQVARTLALNGAGLLYAPEPCLSAPIEAELLRPVLADWVSLGAGFHIYYSSRRQVPSGLRLLIDLIRELQPLGL